MLIISLLLGVFFFAIAFIVNSKNADTLLSGYNTMSDQEKAEFPLEDYLKAFKAFHIRFGILFTVASVILWLINPEWLGYHMGITPIIAYLFFMYSTKSLTQTKTNKRLYLLGTSVLVAVLLGVIGLFYWSESDSDAFISDRGLEVTGAYGVIIPFEEIDSIALLDELPEIRTRIHGISTGTVSKGKYKGAASDIRYHLIVEHPTDLILSIRRKNGIPVLIALDGVSEKQLFEQLQEDLDQL